MQLFPLVSQISDKNRRGSGLCLEPRVDMKTSPPNTHNCQQQPKGLKVHTQSSYKLSGYVLPPDCCFSRLFPDWFLLLTLANQGLPAFR